MKGRKTTPRGYRRRTNKAGRTVHPADARVIIRALNSWSEAGSFVALRTRALVFLAWGSGLRIGECLALDIEQIRDTSYKRLRLRERPYLRLDQAKGESAGQFLISARANTALRAYLLEARRRGWIPDTWTGPLFITTKTWRGSGHKRLAYRSHNYTWTKFVKRCNLPEAYRFHDLRHDSITRYAVEVNGDAFAVQQFGRFADLNTAQVYVHETRDYLDAAKRAAI